jgi:hypothetical protein
MLRATPTTTLPAHSRHDPNVYNGQPEPPSAARFMSALQKGDADAMRAEITPQCINDMDSNLCFDPDGDANFKHTTSTYSIKYNFVGVFLFFGSEPYKVVVYSIVVHRIRDNALVSNDIYELTLAPDGKILRAVFTSVTPVPYVAPRPTTPGPHAA